MEKKIYYIGGSPCSGKSTVAEQLANEYNLYYFKVDDYLDKYLQQGVLNNKSACIAENGMDFEESMMKEAASRVKHELEYYREIFEYIKQDIESIDDERPIIVEGAAFLPELVGELGVSKDRYICIVPTKEFQVEHYKKREWIWHFLSQCSNKEKMFNNWMDRDAGFAIEVRKQCDKLEYESILVDGSTPANEIAKMVSKHFKLEKKYGKKEKGTCRF